MKKFYYSDGVNQYGPFTLEELKEKNLSRNTLVWFSEMEDWKPAGEVPEFKTLFEQSPPPLSQPEVSLSGKTLDSPPSRIKPKNYLVEAILVTLFCCLPFGIAAIVNAAKVDSRYAAGDVDGAFQSSDEAKKWTYVSFWLGLVGVVLYFFMVLAGGLAGGF